MIRQCALRWAAVLTLAATVVIAPLPARFPTALAQDTAVDAGEPAELAIAALHCAEAPASDALTAFFTTGAAPGGCAPAVGVTISVSEDGDPSSSSPAATDVNGIVVLPVTLGAAVEVREDPASLPDGYAPLTQEANGVPYANPVQIDSAVAGAAVLFVNVPHGAATELAQQVPAREGEASTNLAVLALQCAAAPTTETLTSFFSSGTPPGGCAPAVGVRVAVTENAQPLAGSPFTTGADGALSVPVGVGAAVSVKEDLASLPGGYEPLTQAANGVPYANPVELAAATADSAVLFVNVPASVATHLAQVAAPNRAGCDPAYPDARTCIAPGRPLAVPCSITDQRNFTVLAPDPRRLDADHDGIGCEPIAPAGGTVSRNASGNLATSTVRRAAPVRTGGTAVAASQMRSNAGAWGSAPASRRATTQVVQRDRGNAGLWYAAPARTGTGNVAIVSNPVFIANGLWCWPDRVSRDDWLWRQRNLRYDGSRFLPSTLHAGNVTVAGSGSGNVAIVSNPVFISQGVWAWPDRDHDNAWQWRNRAGSGGWSWGNRADHGNWSWPTWFNIGNVTVARSGTGNIAIASNPVFIGRGVWHWPGRMNAGGWPGLISTGNLVIARSGDNVAIVSNPVVIISSGLWYVPPAHNHDHDWYDHRDDDHGDHDNGDHNGDDHGDHNDGDHGNHDNADAYLMQGGSAQAEPTDDTAQAIAGDSASEPLPSETEPLAASAQPALTVNGGLAVEPAPADAVPPAGDGAVAAPSDTGQAAGSDEVALPSEGTAESPADGAVAAPADTAAPPPAVTDAPAANDAAPDSGYVAPDPGYIAPDPGYVAPDPAVDTAYVEPTYVEPVYVEQEPAYVDAGADSGYVAPEPSYVEPSYAEPVSVEQEPAYVDAGNVDTGWVAPDPVFAPSANEPEPSVVDTGFAADDVAPEPVYVAPEPSFVDTGGGAADSGLDGGFGGQNANTVAPEPNLGNPGMDGGNAGGGNMTPDLGPNDAGNGDVGGGASEEDGGGGG